MAGLTAQQLVQAVLGLYHDLHAHPELSGHEQRTARTLAHWLEEDGYQVSTGIGGHGVVGVWHNGPGPTVLLRAELDALPVLERTELPYASTVNTVMHACGHDAHLAALAGASRLLAAERAQWQGTLLVVGQPAEETLTGAQAMLADGLYQRWGVPDVAIAQHLAPLPAGLIAHAGAAITLGCAVLEITIRGRGGHAAVPRQDNPISALLAIALAIDTEAGSLPDQVTAICAIQAGTTGNVIPDEARLLVSVRSPAEPVLVTALERIGALVERVRPEQVSVDVRTQARTRALAVDPERTASVIEGHRELFGNDRILTGYQTGAAEDFVHFAGTGQPAIPLLYWMLGCIGPRAWAAAPGQDARSKLASVPMNHSARFAPDPIPTLHTAVLALHSAALRMLRYPTSAHPTQPERLVHEARHLTTT